MQSLAYGAAQFIALRLSTEDVKVKPAFRVIFIRKDTRHL
jgi:hypothetical protein